MPGESRGRLALSVGQQEFEELTDAWGSYLEATRNLESVDPVLAMQRTGTVLRSLEHLMATLEAGAQLSGADGEDPPPVTQR